MTNSSGSVLTAQQDFILKGRVLPWLLTIVTVLLVQRIACLLNDIGILGAVPTQDAVLFCGIVAGGITPRAIPNAVHLKVTRHGIRIRDVFVFSGTNWRDIVGPFEARRSILGEFILCPCRRGHWPATQIQRLQFYNHFDVPTSILVDILNMRWRSFQDSPQCSAIDSRKV